ncbi:sulfur carrier protein ThiS [bacterium]|nr:sulfur carrier protein ThiS [bacterium]
MKIIVNGEEKNVQSGTTVQTFLDMLDIEGRTVVVERNGEIHAHSDFRTLELCVDDQLEIVRFLGGG